MAAAASSEASASSAVTATQGNDIYFESQQCKHIFVQYLEQEREYNVQISTCQSRFLTWASFLGVFARESASLDSRLQYAPDIKELVLAMLRLLRKNLQRGIQQHRLVERSSRNISDEGKSKQEDGIMYGITGAIERLNRLAMVIRHSSRIDEVERVQNFAAKQDPESEATVSAIVSSTIRFLFPDTEETLRSQLAESVIYRRHRLLWNRIHSRKLAHERPRESPPKPTKEKSHASGIQSLRSPRHPRRQDNKALAGTEDTLSSTRPSIRPFAVQHLEMRMRSQNNGRKEDAQSERGSSFLPTARYPVRPNTLVGKTHVQCEYCFDKVEIPANATPEEKDAVWRAHVDKDLRLYVCVSEDCGNLPPTFPSPRDWKVHMHEVHGADWNRSVHRAKWSCPDCGKEENPFLTQNLLIRHLKEDKREHHAPGRSTLEVAEIAAKSKKTRLRNPDVCPLCLTAPPWYDPWKASKAKPEALAGLPDDLHKHFATHLRDLAFFSLHWWDSDTGLAIELEGGSKSSDVVGFNSKQSSIQKRHQKAKEPRFTIRLGDEQLETAEAIKSVAELDSQANHHLLNNREPTEPPDPKLFKPSKPSVEPPVEPPYTQEGPVFSLWQEVQAELRHSKLRILLWEAQETRMSRNAGASSNDVPANSSSDSWPSAEGQLEDDIFKGLVKSKFFPETGDFLPEGHIHKLVSPETVVKELPTLDPESQDDVRLFGFILEEAKKIFATSVLAGLKGRNLRAAMDRFYSSGFNDTLLPMADPSLKGLEQNASSQFFAHKPWNNIRRYSFFITQWKFLAPVFLPTRFTFKLDPNYVLPFTWCSQSARMGAFGRVLEAQIHPNHFNAALPIIGSHLAQEPEGNHPSVALKEMIELDDGTLEERAHGWELEAEILKEVGNINHPHIIESIAALKIGNRRYLMFEWADGGNLRDLWKVSSFMSQLTPELVKEVVVELRGLADAVYHLHEIGIRHGDLKPENILKVQQGSSRVGRLKISDMGLAKKHTVSTTQRNNLTTTRFGTIRYEPPEAETSEGPISRLYDIWSIGCILLEWIICLLYGYDELMRFTRSLNLHQFFDIPLSGRTNARIRPFVVDWMDHLARDPECRGDTAFSNLLNLVRTKLLVVQMRPSEERSWLLRTEPEINTVAPADNIEHRPSRATARELRDALDDILRKAEQDESFLFSGRTRLSSSGPPGQKLEPSTSTPDEWKSDQLNYRRDHFNLVSNEWQFIVNNDFTDDDTNRDDYPPIPRLTGRCSSCQNLDFWDPKFSFNDSISNLKENARTCELCALLLKVCTGVSLERVLFERHDSTIFMNQTTPVLSIVITRSKLRDPIQVGKPLVPYAGSPSHFAIIRKWLKQCDTEHQACANLKSSSFMPTRLIDVGEDGAPLIHLYQTKPGQLDKYLALTHPWGRHQLCTNRSNIQHHFDGIDINTLPTTILDAVKTTRALGLRYLWIDSLCIIQGPDGDFVTESKRMENVFSHAYCVIAATRATSSDDGFLKPRLPRDVVQVDGDPSLYVCAFIDNFDADVLNSQLHRRAWTLSERALARRSVFFAENQTYWECGDGIRCETGTKIKNERTAFLGDSNFPEKAMARSSDANIQLIQHLFATYSQMELSHDADRPLAIFGLQTRLSKALGWKAKFGVFDDGSGRGILQRSLLWQRGDTRALKAIMFMRGHEHVPSWSWMGYAGPINYIYHSAQVSWESLRWAYSWEGDDSVARDELVATIRKFTIRFDRGQDILRSQLTFDVPGSDNIDKRLRCVVVGSEPATKTGSGSGNRTLVYVILVFPDIEGPEGPKVYRRVGVGRLTSQDIDYKEGVEARIW